MKLRVTRHAAERMRERSITLEEVRVCIEEPDYLEESRGLSAAGREPETNTS